MAKTTIFVDKEIRESVPVRRLPDYLIASGQPVVTIERIGELVGLPRRSLHTGLQRLRRDRRLFSPARGLYVTVPPEYHSWGVVPADWFIDPMMEHLERRYYVALLTAAALHGAGSESPQVFQVMVDRQLAARDIGRVRLRFHLNSLLSDRTFELPLETRTTHTGKLWVSSPELTAIDLVTNPDLSGGLHNVVDVLTELELSDGVQLAAITRRYPRVTARRMGWILEHVTDHRLDLAPLRRIAAPTEGEPLPLDHHAPRAGTLDRGWGIIANADLEAGA